MMWFWYGLAIWTAFLFAAFGIWVAAVYGFDRWYRRKPHDPETCDECRYGEERNEWFR